MFTLYYKGYYLHGYCDRDIIKCYIDNKQHEFISLLSAKRAINKLLKGKLVQNDKEKTQRNIH